MKTSTLLTATLASASAYAAVLRPQARQSLDWTATGFSISSTNSGPTEYLFSLNGEGQSVTCSTDNSVASSQCPGVNGPAPFTNTACEQQLWSPFSFSLENSTSPMFDGGEVYFVKVTYQDSTGTEIVGCSPEFQASDYTCTGNGETLNVPSSFSFTEGNDGQCLYF